MLKLVAYIYFNDSKVRVATLSTKMGWFKLKIGTGLVSCSDLSRFLAFFTNFYKNKKLNEIKMRTSWEGTKEVRKCWSSPKHEHRTHALLAHKICACKSPT